MFFKIIFGTISIAIFSFINQFYRFTKPADGTFPYMLELLLMREGLMYPLARKLNLTRHFRYLKIKLNCLGLFPYIFISICQIILYNKKTDLIGMINYD